MMMRLVLAAMMFPAVAAAPTCTQATCCTDKRTGFCYGNTHDANDAKLTAAQIVAANVACAADGSTVNKGIADSTATGTDAAACCVAAPTPAPAYACNDKDGDGTTDDPVTDTDCGAGWEAADATTSLTVAFSATVEETKVKCCTICPFGQFATATGECTAHGFPNCPAGKQPKYAAGDGADCANEAGCCEDCGTGKWNNANDASLCADHSPSCNAWEYLTAGSATADRTCTAHGITNCPTAGNGPKATVLAGTMTSDCANEAACCETCAAGTWAAANNAAACAAHSTCPADDYITTAGSTTADVVCGDCAAGKTTAAANSATECADVAGVCMGLPDGDDDGTELDDFPCSTGTYVAADYVSPITTAAVTEACTATPATTAATIVDAITTCTLTDATCTTPAVTDGSATAGTCTTGFDQTEASCSGADSAGTACVYTAGTCAVATGGGSCTYVPEVIAVGGVGPMCPEPVVEAKTTSSAAAAGPLALAAALVALLA